MLHELWHAHSTRFAVVGLAMTALHLVVFTLVLPWSVPETANVVAFLTATQVNFALSYSWTWSSRRPLGQETVGYVIRRAFLFNGSALLGFSLNAVVFSTAYRIVGMPPLGSAVVATAASAAAGFLLSSRVVFTRRPVPDARDAADARDATDATDAVDAAGPQGAGPGLLPPLPAGPVTGWERA
jgi:putative flippase GtrA